MGFVNANAKLPNSDLTEYDIPLDFNGPGRVGCLGLGTAAVTVIDDQTSMVDVLHNVCQFFAHESCGQCTPCREGTGWLYRMVHRIESGRGRPEDLELLDQVSDNIAGRTICALGDAAALPVKSFIKHFRDEFVHHIQHKQCLVKNDIEPRWGRSGAEFQSLERAA